MTTVASNKAPWPDRPIFVIDDDMQWLTVLKQALGSLGLHRVRTLSDPSFAVQLASEFRPAAVLLDLLMAEKDGRQILRELHEQDPDLPIIVITGVDNVENAVNCMRDGASHYLTKPLQRKDLEQALRDALITPESADKGDATVFEDVITELDELPNIKEVPEMLIDEAMRRSKGVVKDAAAMLGISAQAICNRRRRAQSKT